MLKYSHGENEWNKLFEIRKSGNFIHQQIQIPHSFLNRGIDAKKQNGKVVRTQLFQTLLLCL